MCLCVCVFVCVCLLVCSLVLGVTPRVRGNGPKKSVKIAEGI